MWPSQEALPTATSLHLYPLHHRIDACHQRAPKPLTAYELFFLWLCVIDKSQVYHEKTVETLQIGSQSINLGMITT